MSITISSMMQMAPFSRFRLIAGMNGIERNIDTVNILDFEYSPEYEPSTKSLGFEPNALVLSSLLFAKGHPELLLDTVNKLIHEKVAALAIKSVIYSELPKEVMEYANNHHFPIFMFGENDGYFEDLILFLIDEIHKSEDDSHMEQNLLMLQNDHLPRLEVQRIAQEMIPGLKPPYQMIALFPDNSRTVSWKQVRNTRKSLNIPLLSCQRMLFTSVEAEKNKVSNLLLRDICGLLGLDIHSCHVGYGCIHQKLEEFDYAVQESQYACDFAQRQKKAEANFFEIGLYQILYPYHNHYWMKAYCQETLSKIKDYDATYNSNLLETAISYIQNDADTAKTAKALYIHKNTVHYRINKIKEILGMESASAFYERLSLAIHAYQFFG